MENATAVCEGNGMKVTSVNGVEQMLKESREQFVEGGKKFFYVPTVSKCPTIIFSLNGQVQTMRSCKPFVSSYLVVCEQQRNPTTEHNHHSNVLLIVVPVVSAFLLVVAAVIGCCCWLKCKRRNKIKVGEKIKIMYRVLK